MLSLMRTRRIRKGQEKMQSCIITTTTMTLAMKGQKLLGDRGIATYVSRLPGVLTVSGCAWGITIDCAHAREAKEILENMGFTYGKFAYRDGTPLKWDTASINSITGTPRARIIPRGEGWS